MNPTTHGRFVLVRAPNGDVREFFVSDFALVLGRDESADIRVDDKKVSRRHAGFRFEDGAVWVEDLGSSNNVFVNDQRIERRTKISDTDEVRVGGYQIVLKPAEEELGFDRSTAAVVAVGLQLPSEPEKPKEREASSSNTFHVGTLRGLSGPLAGKKLKLSVGEVIVGRLEDCDLALLDNSVSRQHARLEVSASRVYVQDLGSSNGTYLDDFPIESASLEDGDRLRFGKIEFRVELPGYARTNRSLQERAQVVAPLRRKLHDKKILGVGVLLSFVLGAGIWVGFDDVNRQYLERHWARVRDGVMGRSTPENVATLPLTGSGTVAVDKNAFRRVMTATAPFSPRDQDGLPVALPVVPAGFHFDGFVTARLERARDCEASGDLACMRAELKTLKGRDPINAEALGLEKRADLTGSARATLLEADQLALRGAFAQSLRALETIPEGAPQYVEAQMRRQEMLDRAIAQELKQAANASERRMTWHEAQSRYKYVLGLAPENTEALTGLRRIEKEMRAHGMSHLPYRPFSGTASSNPPDAVGAIERHYAGREAEKRVALEYVRGAIRDAERAAQAIRNRKDQAKMLKVLGELRDMYKRVLGEVSRDPSQAWARLMEFKDQEQHILPKDVHSFLAKEIEVTLSDAFAERGASLFERAEFQDAFLNWEAGYRLDPANPMVMAGLRKLNEKAAEAAKDAELASERGETDLCRRWTDITRMTRAGSEVHKYATIKAAELCER
jgi:pSer/pThr/pTyr-binding forkhead associated (FHA) protein